jgi:hypothetical protein
MITDSHQTQVRPSANRHGTPRALSRAAIVVCTGNLPGLNFNAWFINPGGLDMEPTSAAPILAK